MIKYLTNLIKSYKYTITPYSRGIFLPKLKRIRIDNFTSETFTEIFNILITALGEPVYTHSFYGHLWKKGDKVIAYCQIEEQPHYESLNILLLNVIPIGNKMPYEEYSLIDTAVKSFADKYSLLFYNCITYNDTNKMSYLLYSNTRELLLNIGKKTINYYLSIIKHEEIGDRHIPKSHGKKSINRKSNENVNKALNEIFDELGTI